MENKIIETLKNDAGFERGLKRERTLKKYSQLLENHIGLKMLNGANYEQLYNILLNINLTISTKKLLYCALRKWYLLKGDYDIVKLLESRKPKFTSGRNIRFLTYEEVMKIFRSCGNDKDRLVYETFICCGLRCSILLALKPENIKNSQIEILRDMQGNKAKQNFNISPPSRLMSRLNIYKEDKKEYLFDFRQNDTITDERRIGLVDEFLAKISLMAQTTIINSMYLRHTFGVIHYNTYKDILKTRDAMTQLSVSATEKYATSVREWEDKGKELLEKGFDYELSDVGSVA